MSSPQAFVHALLPSASRFNQMILTNARLILPDGLRDGLEIVVAGGKIAEIRERAAREALDLGGNYLAPGFVDLHVHGALGRDTMEASPDVFRAICSHHATGGTTSLLLTTVTASCPKIANVLQAVREFGNQNNQIVGVHVEGPFISRARAGAQRADFICDPSPEETAPLFPFMDVIRRVTLAPELAGALDFIEQLGERGVSVSGGHSDAWDEEARAGFERGMRSVTHTFNCMSSMRRRGIERVAGLLEVALSEPTISCELIADGHHVSPTLMKLLYRAKGRTGICLVSDATAGAGLPNGTRFEVGGRDCVTAEGVCRLADGSALAGSSSRMIDLVRMVVSSVGVPLHEAIRMATMNPAAAIGLEKRKGALIPGADADFVVLSPELHVLQTYVAGECVYSASGDARATAQSGIRS
ncbi:MAG: N-acetylglucosamine-6-phosphate deacetylase [Chthoniobacterales bacterium]